jgi:hypothetical protein
MQTCNIYKNLPQPKNRILARRISVAQQVKAHTKGVCLASATKRFAAKKALTAQQVQ